MLDKSVEWEKAWRDERKAKEIEAENYRLLMLQLRAFQSGNGVKPNVEVFQNWKASMQARLHHSSFRVHLGKP